MIRLLIFLIGIALLGFLVLQAWRLLKGRRVRLVLLDRDGVINVDRADYVKSVEEFDFIEGGIDAIKALNEAGIKVVVVTNQGGIGRGLYTREDLEAIHGHMKDALKAQGAWVDHIFFCADHPDSPTHRRKPGAGMLEEALRCTGIPPQETHMVGDALRDLIPAHQLGINRHLVLTGKGEKTLKDPKLKDVFPVQIHGCLKDAVDFMVAPA